MISAEKKSAKKAWEDAYLRIEQLILDSRLVPGDYITENSLAEQLGISRTPIRDAIKKLEEKGLIVSINGRKRIHLLTIHEMSEVFDIKICLEKQVVRWAIERGCPEEFEELGVLMGEMRNFVLNSSHAAGNEEDELQQWLEIDRRLHQLIFYMARAPKTESIIQTLNMQWHRLKIGSLTLEGRMKRSIHEHEKFVRAILDKKPDEAEQSMQMHLQTIKNEMIKLMTLFQYPA
ncbi:GntR family transcriptional regulator [Arundinibacter roseus]|uniref:GntR family transcriptional regulator n=1 Tax=Arundinibacter roseus TaxID=2070510 RepID=A0A4R4K831_9BACT|nr:GntR family transcriptional regulator [Arundinibacter roseus]TDB62706.1 GntR family transcriptional regulator [Arundinibacter roseus]